MKKILASLIILTTITCTVTGCGNKENKENESSSKSETTTLSEDTKTSEVTTTDQIEEKTTVSDNSVEKAEYEEILKEFVEAYINNDRKKTFEMQEPDGFLDIISAVQQIEYAGEFRYKGLTEEEFISEWQWKLYKDYDEDKKEEKAVFKRIVNSEPIQDEEELYDIKEEFAYDKWLSDYVNEHGGSEKVDIDKFNEAWHEMDDDLGDTVNFTESYRVTFEVDYEKKGKVAQGEAIVSRLDGKEWKIFVPSNIFIVTKSENATSSIINAQNYVLEQRWDIQQKMDTAFIVSSDSNKNYNIPDYFNNSNFIEKTKECLNESYYSFKNLDDAEWFSVLYNWDVLFCVAYVKDQPDQIGIYPKSFSAWGKEIFTEINEKISYDMTYDEVYQVCVDTINK